MTKPLRFELFDLRLYVAIVEAGSLSKAAASLPLALSAASARLKMLEQRLNMLLLKRSSQGVKMTNAGHLFYEHAQRLLQAAQEAQQGMEALSGKGRIKLKLFSNTTGLSTDLSNHLAGFLVENDSIDLLIEQRASKDVVKSIASGEADIGIVDGHYNRGDLLYLLYQRNRLVVIANKEHSLAQQTSCRFTDWLKESLVGYEPESSLQQFLERMALFERLPPKFKVNAPSFGAVAQMVASRVGIAVMPEPAARRYAAALPLTIIDLAEPWSTRELHICVRPQLDTTLPTLKLARYLSGIE
ncbi:LysR substrate-binding domain-containing protein [Aliikangiella sp. IMCC44359]|uniref:LysR substrate-binding domain-containing protein n=1 Tax=Aliikangiella sp. IMCC44359 TaxID=3459125 RepID=UPI00403B3798